MECNTMDQCFERIEAYCQKEITGHPLLVNAENDHDFQCLVKRMRIDGNKTCYREQGERSSSEKAKEWICHEA